MPKLEYPVIIEPLPDNEGGGFVALVPDLPGCMSDGRTPEEALVAVRDATSAWIEEGTALGRVIPRPLSVLFLIVARRADQGDVRCHCVSAVSASPVSCAQQ